MGSRPLRMKVRWGCPPRVLSPPPHRTQSWRPCLPGQPCASGWRSTDCLVLSPRGWRSTDRPVPSPRGWTIGFSEWGAAHNRALPRCLSSRRCMRSWRVRGWPLSRPDAGAARGDWLRSTSDKSHCAVPREGDVHHGGPGAPSLAQPGRDEGRRQGTLSQRPLPGRAVRRHRRGLRPAVLGGTAADRGDPAHPAPAWCTIHRCPRGQASVCPSLFLRRRREQRSSFPRWRAGRRIFCFVCFCSAAGPRASGTHLLRERAISFSSGFSGPWDDSVRRPASSLSPTTHFASSQESTVRGRHSSPRTSGQSRSGPREFSEDASECTAFCAFHPYSLSLHHHRYVDCAVGAACTASGGVAHAAQPVSLAHTHNSTRLRDSVRQSTSQVQRRSRDVGGSPERPCLARGDCCPPGKGCNRAGPSSRDEAGVLQPLLHRTQERWWPSSNPGSASLEPGFAQAPVQDADTQAHDQMHSAPGLVYIYLYIIHFIVLYCDPLPLALSILILFYLSVLFVFISLLCIYLTL